MSTEYKLTPIQCLLNVGPASPVLDILPGLVGLCSIYIPVLQCNLTMVIWSSKNDIARIPEGNNLIQLKRTVQTQRIEG